MNEFYIFRHGETDVTKNHLSTYSDHLFDAPILPEFIPSIQKMGGFLKNIPSQMNFSSEILRCRQTVEIVSQVADKKFEFDSRLNEVLPEESITDLAFRTADFLNDLKKYNSQTVMICTHGVIIAALASLAVKNRFTDEEYNIFPLPGVIWRITDKIEEVFKI